MFAVLELEEELSGAIRHSSCTLRGVLTETTAANHHLVSISLGIDDRNASKVFSV